MARWGASRWGGDGGGGGGIAGPDPSVDKALPRWVGTGGDELDSSLASVADDGTLLIYSADRTKFVGIGPNDGGNQTDLFANNGRRCYFNAGDFNFQHLQLREFRYLVRDLAADFSPLQAQSGGEIITNRTATGTVTIGIDQPSRGAPIFIHRLADFPLRFYSLIGEQILTPGHLGVAGEYLELAELGASVIVTRHFPGGILFAQPFGIVSHET